MRDARFSVHPTFSLSLISILVPHIQTPFISFSRLFSALTGRERPVTDGRRGGGGGGDDGRRGGHDPVRSVRITFVTIARLNNLETCIRGVAGDAMREREKERENEARARAVTDGFTIGPRR